MRQTLRQAGRGIPAGTMLLRAAWMTALLAPAPGSASDSVRLELGSLQGEGWRVDNPRAELDLGGDESTLRVTLPAIVAGDDRVLAREVSLTCQGVAVNAAYVICPEGQASLVFPPAERALSTSANLVLRRADGQWRAEGRVALAGGMRWQASGGAPGFSATATADAVTLAELEPWLPHLPGGVASVAGTLSGLSLDVQLPADGPARIRGSLQGEGLGFDTAQGTVAAAGVAGDADFDWRAGGDGWQADAEVTVRGGEVLAGSFYTSLAGAPLRISGALSATENAWRVHELDVEQPGALSLSATALWDWRQEQGLRELDARVAEARFPGLYQGYLQSILAQFGFGELETAGSATGRVRMREGAVDLVDLGLDHLDISDSRGRLQVTDLDGDLRWRADGEPRGSRVTWQDGRVYSIGIGSADIRAEAAADSLRLMDETVVPVLDGALVVNALRVDDWFGERPELLFDAQLMPISLGRLSGALGWPELKGTLGGRLPELTFADGVYRLGGSLSVDLFDGRVAVENLRLERPFGVLPKLVADIEVHELDLERLTGTFTIGRITGLISGYVKNLRLLDWQPVHFDARLATPADAETRQRISQRAVDTLSNLGGGGAGGALSRTFLRMFDDFAYRRLGISCRLRNNVCEMDGVAPAPGGGYFLVEGGGLPRVDVIGYVRRVDWPVLMEQLMKSMQGQPPTVGQ